MKVFVLTEGVDYEGEAPIGVYSNSEAAVKALHNNPDINPKWHYYSLYEFEVDACPILSVDLKYVDVTPEFFGPKQQFNMNGSRNY